jgi:hypothetical protein
MYIFEFSILYLYPGNLAEKWIHGYVAFDDISYAANKIMDELDLEPENISSIKIERGKTIIVL